MLRTLKKLVDDHFRAGSFLESPHPWLDATTIHPVSEQLGDTIGPYTLVEQIGQGGMGVVYRAKQTEPIKRSVALKVIKPGMDSRAVIARFQAERQALALMDHPHIAKVLDAGATDTGRPYFVLELVKGIPITDYCDGCAYCTRDRLELFVQVCQAIHHAHERGIIHRDVKPSNVLIEMRDGEPAPKVIDFGVAKAMGRRLTEHTLTTGFAQMLGTPLYMSPEQAEMSPVDVDVRSDVYSLGVLLYQLLTGTTPFDEDRLRTANFDELRRIIREEEPPKPSTRLSTLGDQAATIAENRRTRPHRLQRELRGDLDWIVMKALEKDPRHRYVSANALATDVQRYLDNRPTLARPPSLTGRALKWSRRHTGLVLSTAVILLTSTVALTIATVFIARARYNQEAEARRANANLRFAIAAVDEMYSEVADTSLSTIPEAGEFRRQILEKALKFYLTFAEKNVSPELQYETAMAWRRAGEAYHRIERNEESRDALLNASSRLEALVSSSPDEPRYRQDLAGTAWFLSKVFEVAEEHEQSGLWCRKALEIQKELVVEFPKESEYRAQLATTYHQLGHQRRHCGAWEESVAALTVSSQLFQALRAETPENASYLRQLAHNYDHLGELRREVGELHEADTAYRLAIELISEARGPSDADVVDSYASIHGGVLRGWGIVLRQEEHVKEAQAAHRESVRLFDELVRHFPSVVYYRSQLGLSKIELGKTLAAAEEAGMAMEVIQAAGEIFAELETRFPSNPAYRRGRTEAESLIYEESVVE